MKMKINLTKSIYLSLDYFKLEIHMSKLANFFFFFFFLKK